MESNPSRQFSLFPGQALLSGQDRTLHPASSKIIETRCSLCLDKSRWREKEGLKRTSLMQTMTGTPLVMITVARTKTCHAVPKGIKVIMTKLTDKVGRSRIHEELLDPEDLNHMSSGITASPKIFIQRKTAHKKRDDAFITFCKHRPQGSKTDLNYTLRKMKFK